MRNRDVALLAVFLLSLSACGGGGGGDNSTPQSFIPSVVETPVVETPVVEPPIVVPPLVDSPLVQMSKPTDCPTDYVGGRITEEYQFVTCDGIRVKADVDFPYDRGNTEIAIIDLLAVVDNKLDDELNGLSYAEFVDREIVFANKVFKNSGVHIVLRVVDLKTVRVAKGDLYRQITTFSKGDREFNQLDVWQKESGADFAFLFKKIEDDPLACGVALYDTLREEYRYRRGITQCFRDTVFNNTSTTRYYERAGETFTHEMGHLFGMDHNIESSTVSGGPLFKYSYGYLIPGYDPDLNEQWNGYGTVMSYSDKATGKFSDRDERFVIPETGDSQALGQEFDPPTDGVDHLNRVRWYMSQLHEMFNTGETVEPTLGEYDGITFGFEIPDDRTHICL